MAARTCNVSFQRYNTNSTCSGTVTALALDSRVLTVIPELLRSDILHVCAGQVGISAGACD